MNIANWVVGFAGALALSSSTAVATLSPIADTLTVFNPDGTIFRSASLTVAQEHGGATEVIAVSFESVPGAGGSLLPLLNVNGGINVLLKPATVSMPPTIAFPLPPGTIASDAWGIFTLSGSVPGAFFLDFVTGDAISGVGLPGEFALVPGGPITFLNQNTSHSYDATSFLSVEAVAAGYTATYQDKVPDGGSTCLLLGLAVSVIGWFGTRKCEAGYSDRPAAALFGINRAPAVKTG